MTSSKFSLDASLYFLLRTRAIFLVTPIDAGSPTSHNSLCRLCSSNWTGPCSRCKPRRPMTQAVENITALGKRGGGVTDYSLALQNNPPLPSAPFLSTKEKMKKTKERKKERTQCRQQALPLLETPCYPPKSTPLLYYTLWKHCLGLSAKL